MQEMSALQLQKIVRNCHAFFPRVYWSILRPQDHISACTFQLLLYVDSSLCCLQLWSCCCVIGLR